MEIEYLKVQVKQLDKSKKRHLKQMEKYSLENQYASKM